MKERKKTANLKLSLVNDYSIYINQFKHNNIG